MADWNLGSAATSILNLVENVPTAISGAELIDIVDRQRIFIEEFTGLSLGSTGITERFQPALISLSVAATLDFMNLIGADTSSMTLGEFSTTKGGESNLAVTAAKFQQRGMDQLNKIGIDIRFNRTF